MFGNGQRELLQLGQWRGNTVTSFVNFVKRKKIIDIITSLHSQCWSAVGSGNCFGEKK